VAGIAVAVVALLAVLAAGVFAPGVLAPGAETTDPLVSAARYADDPGGISERNVVVTPTPSPVPTPSPAPVAAPPLKNAPFRMVVERIGIDAPVNTYGLDAYGAPVVPLNAYEVAWYDWSAPPGTGSNAVMAGHVTWSGQAVFYRLNTLVAGDTVRLIGEDGTELLYTVRDTYLVDPIDPDALQVMAPTPDDIITIITCDGSFYYTGDPVFRGDYTNRRVVQASLTSVRQAPAAAG
jgi:LPXTG-site transpeptidase (sortase) family protein